MKKVFFISVLFVAGCLFLVASVLAVGVGVKPKEIDLKVTVGKSTETEILVVNVADEPALYQVYPDALENEITIKPADFQLAANGTRLVKVIVKIRNSGRYATNISVVTRPLGSQGLSVASGVKVPIVIVATGIAIWRLVFGVVLGVCLLIIFMIKLRKRKL